MEGEARRDASSPPKGQRQRRRILAAALDLASAEGLEGLTLGRLARQLGLSKSGLFAHFGSKQALQRAAVNTAAGVFDERVLRPAQSAPPGLARLRSLVECWLSYVEGVEYRGGCFFQTASVELGSRPGPLRDRLARLTGSWLRAMTQETALAMHRGELRPDVDPRRLAFALHALVQEANWARQLFDDPDAFATARAAIEDALDAAAAARG